MLVEAVTQSPVIGDMDCGLNITNITYKFQWLFMACNGDVTTAIVDLVKYIYRVLQQLLFH